MTHHAVASRIGALLAAPVLLVAGALVLHSEERVSPSFPVSELMVKGGVFDDTLAEAQGPTIVGREAVVVSGNAHASMVGHDILRRGGNAFDAGVATAAALNVTKFHHAGWVGVTPFIGFNVEENRVAAYAGVGTAPAAATPEHYAERGYDVMPDDIFEGALVPSQPDSFFAILKRWGTMSFAEVIQGALELAEHGFPAHIFHVAVARGMDRDAYIEAGDTYGLDYWQPDGRAPALGEFVSNPDLANTFQIMIDAEQAALEAGHSREQALDAARDAFYRGEIAERIAAFFAERDGLLTYDDLAGYEGAWVEQDELPMSDFMGVEVYATPEWTQCGVLIQALNILEHFDLKSMGWNSPDYIHVITQAFNLAMADRWQHYGDPAFVDIPRGLYSREYARLRAELIDMERAFPGAAPPGDPVNMRAVLPRDERVAHPRHGEVTVDAGDVRARASALDEAYHVDTGMRDRTADTSYLAVVDREGNVFSMTPSDGSVVPHSIIPGLGLGFYARMTQFTLHDPRHTHFIAPGKRTMATPNPALAVRDGRGYFAIGTPGGDQQPQAMLQVMLNRMLWDMSEQMAVDQPRFGSYNFYGMFSPHPYAPGVMNLEDAFPDEVQAELEARGHVVERWDPGVAPTSWRAGSVGFITRDPETGLLRGGADRRRESYAVGW